MIVAPQTVTAISFTSFDARSMAMGGAGVATARPYNAAFFNPALLITGKSQDKGYFLRPYLGVRLIDRDHFIDSLDTFQTRAGNDKLNTSVTNFEALVSSGIGSIEEALNLINSAQSIIREADDLLTDFEALSNKPLRVAGSSGLTVGYARDESAFAISLRRNLIGGTIINLSEADLSVVGNLVATTEQFVEELEMLLPTNPTPQELQSFYDSWSANDYSGNDSLSSTLEFTGAIVEELSLSYAWRIVEFPGWTMGINFKRINFTTVDYKERIDAAEPSDFDNKGSQKSYRDLNLDIGVAGQVGRYSRMGLVIRNIIAHDYQTIRNRTIALRPLVRVGIAWEPEWYTLTADLDITNNDPLGYDPDKRYLGLGGEWRIRQNMAMRLGYRYNLANGSDLWSTGLGIGSQNAHADIAIATQGDESGLSIQFAMYF